MSRGLGRSQRDVVQTLERLRAHGLQWVSPATVIAHLPRQSMDAKTLSLNLTLQLITARSAAAKGDKSAAKLAAQLEQDGVTTSWKSSSFTLPAKRTRRPTTPTHKRINPARIFDALEKRGIVIRSARPGPTSRLRLAETWPGYSSADS